jgi:hypothetical protein
MGRKSKGKQERRNATLIASQGAGSMLPAGDAAFHRQLLLEEEGAFDHLPLEVFRERGSVYPPAAALDDQTLESTLARLIDDMADIGMILSSTDHLSDRELYEKLVGEILLEPVTIHPEGITGFTFIDILGGWSQEDMEIYLRYYADEEKRRDWAEDYGEPIPPREKPPYDRDRHLPGYGKF